MAEDGQEDKHPNEDGQAEKAEKTMEKLPDEEAAVESTVERESKKNEDDQDHKNEGATKDEHEDNQDHEHEGAKKHDDVPPTGLAAVIKAWLAKLKEDGSSESDRLTQASIYRKWINTAEIEGLGSEPKPPFTEVWIKLNEKALEAPTKPAKKRKEDWWSQQDKEWVEKSTKTEDEIFEALTEELQKLCKEGLPREPPFEASVLNKGLMRRGIHVKDSSYQKFGNLCKRAEREGLLKVEFVGTTLRVTWVKYDYRVRSPPKEEDPEKSKPDKDRDEDENKAKVDGENEKDAEERKGESKEEGQTEKRGTDEKDDHRRRSRSPRDRDKGKGKGKGKRDRSFDRRNRRDWSRGHPEISERRCVEILDEVLKSIVREGRYRLPINASVIADRMRKTERGWHITNTPFERFGDLLDKADQENYIRVDRPGNGKTINITWIKYKQRSPPRRDRSTSRRRQDDRRSDRPDNRRDGRREDKRNDRRDGRNDRRDDRQKTTRRDDRRDRSRSRDNRSSVKKAKGDDSNYTMESYSYTASDSDSAETSKARKRGDKKRKR
eukprot:gnl/MRDRNA2_/MRDRNA2_98084_c0_seq1.p1 gnl/MRDRNA2_/MRDRNA2_98084_c0~~gnl/MRDRNA2_/MRDRNA2_98084_c0_seq1.p1  ORF type:complete len:551 (+),score=138.31 gnl/MRDRNA2_/MRDRNA2_98084_c0_seq1:70-1722(+)